MQFFPEHQSTEDYSNFEEEIANGIFEYLEDIMEDRLFEAFPEDGDAAEVSDKDEDSEDDTPLEQFHYNRKQMYQIVEHRFGRKHKLVSIQKEFKKFKHLKKIYRMEKYLDDSKRLKEKEIKEELYASFLD